MRTAMQGIPSNESLRRRFYPYPAHRESNVAWLGRVPSNWTVDRLKWTVLACRNGTWGSEPDGIDNIVCVRVADFDRTALRVSLSEPTLRAVSHSERGGRLLSKGDLLIEKSGGGELQPVGAVVQFHHDILAVSSNFIARMPIRNGFDARFLAYLHSHLYTSRVNTRSIKQTTGIQNLDSMAYLSERSAWPTFQEQQGIASFLDRETARIDALIAKKERLIELIQEKRAALISHAVTKGLDPNAPMKESGSQWFGNIPAHWQSNKFGKAAFFQEGPGLRNWQFTDSGVRVICVTNITEAGITFADYEKFISEDEYCNSYRHFTVATGDLLLSSSGNSWGKVAEFYGDETTILNTSTIRVNENRESTLKRTFIKWVLQARSTREQLGLRMTGSCQPNFGPTHLGQTVVAVPPPDEQAKIACYLDEKNTALDCLAMKIRLAIERLREYRSSLISGAVSGKIDVREAVSVPESEPKSDRNLRRAALAAEIIERHRASARFGSVKLQKLIILAERHLQLERIDSQPARGAAGPHDREMMRSIYHELRNRRWFRASKRDKKVVFEPMQNCGSHRAHFDEFWSNQRSRFDNLIQLLAPLKSKQAEIVATLYMAWNDFLIRGEPFNDGRLITEVRDNWHEEKKKITPDRWHRALAWMHKHALAPAGFGSPTVKLNEN